MFSTYFTFRQQENLVDNQKCQAGFRPLCNKILLKDPLMTFFSRKRVPAAINLLTPAFYHRGPLSDTSVIEL